MFIAKSIQAQYNRNKTSKSYQCSIKLGLKGVQIQNESVAKFENTILVAQAHLYHHLLAS